MSSKFSEMTSNGNGTQDVSGNTALVSSDSARYIKPRVYPRRWPMLALFCFYSMSNAYQWIHLNIIGNLIRDYYSPSLPESTYGKQLAIDWLSMIYMLSYIPLIFPATWLLDRKGLRICAILGACGNCLGAWIKCAAVSQSRFGVLMFAQTICACSQLFILGIPARLAAVWFGATEVSTATALGVFGNQVGVAVGFVIPPLIVQPPPKVVSLQNVTVFNASAQRNVTQLVNVTTSDPAAIAGPLSHMFYGGAAVTSLVFILILFVFKNKPPRPPSDAQAAIVEMAANENYLRSIKAFFSNWGFVLLMISYGINTGSYYAISTLLNLLVLKHFPGAEETVGFIGLTIILSGVLGSIAAGVWLDKTKLFKSTTVAIYVLSLGCMIVFSLSLWFWNNIIVIFVVAFALGFFMTGYLPVGFEFAAEITYPESEGTSSGLLNASAQFFGILVTLSMTPLVERVNTLSANLVICGILIIGVIMTAVIKPDLRRQRANKYHAEGHTGAEMERELMVEDEPSSNSPPPSV